MSDHPQAPPNPDGHARAEDATAEHTATTTDTLTTPLERLEWPAADDDAAAGADEEWVSQTTRGVRLGLPVIALLSLVLVAGGFWGGAELEKHHGGSSSSTLASLAARFGRGGTGATGASGSRFGGLGALAGSGATAGTISTVDGDILYVTTTSGLVKVTLSSSTTVTRNADATASALRPGDTVIVQGATGSGGTVAATSVSATAPGVSSGFAGFAGLGSGAGGSTGTGASTGNTSSNSTTTPSLFGK